MRKMNVRWRPILFWSHLVCGVAAGLVIFFLALTGSLLSFEKPILAWSDAQTMSNLQINGPQLPVSVLLERVKATAGQAATSITLPADSRSPITFEVGRDRAFLANPYTGSIAPSSPQLRGFFHFVLTLHRWFALSDANHKTVELVMGSAALVFAFLIVSGCIIWIPKAWTASSLRTRLRPMWPTNSHARNWNWHSAFGFWLALPLLAISLTGVIMGLPWANELLFRATGSPLPQQRGEGRPDSRGGEGKGLAREGGQPRQQHEDRGQHAGGDASPSHAAVSPKSSAPTGNAAMPDKKDHQSQAAHAEQASAQAPRAERSASVDIDRILQAAAHQSQDWHSLQLRIPNGGGRTINVTVDRGNGAQPQYRDTLTYDAQANLQRTETFASQSLGRRARAITRYLHTGEIFGFAGELVGFIACLAACLLVWTGFALSLRRFTRKKQKAAVL